MEFHLLRPPAVHITDHSGVHFTAELVSDHGEGGGDLIEPPSNIHTLIFNHLLIYFWIPGVCCVVYTSSERDHLMQEMNY